MPLGCLHKVVPLTVDACPDVVLESPVRRCAGVTVQLTVALADRPKTCQLIRGVVQNGEFKRSMTR